MKETLALEPADLKKLRRQLIPIIAFPFIAIGMFALFSYFVFSNFDHSFTSDNVGRYIMYGFGILFLGVIGYMIWASAIDIKRGVKHRITGTVTDKRLDVHTSTTHGVGGGRTGGGSSSSRTTRRYYLYIDHDEYSVAYSDYSRARVGNSIILDKAPKSDLTLKMELTGQADVDEEAVKALEALDRKFLDSKLEEVRFDNQDFEALKRGYQRDLKTRMAWLAPFLLIDIGFIANGLWGILVLLFPLVIIPLYQLYRLVKTYTRYQNNKLYAHKVGVTALVEDKTTFTSNRSGGSNNIRTTQGVLKVGTVLYDQLGVGEKIILFFPKHSKQPLSLMKLDKEEIYLY